MVTEFSFAQNQSAEGPLPEFDSVADLWEEMAGLDTDQEVIEPPVRTKLLFADAPKFLHVLTAYQVLAATAI